jgi:hypothetical protein
MLATEAQVIKYQPGQGRGRLFTKCRRSAEVQGTGSREQRKKLGYSVSAKKYLR